MCVWKCVCVCVLVSDGCGNVFWTHNMNREWCNFLISFCMYSGNEVLRYEELQNTRSVHGRENSISKYHHLALNLLHFFFYFSVWITLFCMRSGGQFGCLLSVSVFRSKIIYWIKFIRFVDMRSTENEMHIRAMSWRTTFTLLFLDWMDIFRMLVCGFSYGLETLHINNTYLI